LKRANRPSRKANRVGNSFFKQLFTIVKRLETKQMERVKGGATGDCFTAVLGIIGLGFAVALTPATAGGAHIRNTLLDL